MDGRSERFKMPVRYNGLPNMTEDASMVWHRTLGLAVEASACTKIQGPDSV